MRPEFNCHDDYFQFARSVIRHGRYVFEPCAEEFLSTVAATISDERIAVVEKGCLLARAQLGFEWRSIEPNNPEIDEQIQDAYSMRRMKPLRDSAREGRINPKGIPCLYLSDDENTAMAETRPWIGSFVSLAQFKTLREVRLVSCCEPRQRFKHLSLTRPHLREFDPKTREEVAWGEISYAFSEPVSPTDMTAEYVPTQILADLFRHHGFDGIRYRSLLGKGYNYALFDPDSADLLNCCLYEVKSVSFEFDQFGNPYFNIRDFSGETAERG
jgi:hypothetical protein